MKLFSDQKGQAMILVAVVFVLLCGLGGLAMDTANLVAQKTKLQSAADAAALAGANDMTVNTAINMADQNGMKATANGVKQLGDTVTVTPSYGGDSTKIKVECKRTVSYTFGRVLGFMNKDVSANAVAQKTTGGFGEAFGYTLFSGSTTSPLTLSGCSTIKVTGDSHTNYKMVQSGCSTLTITGACEASNIVSITGCSTVTLGTVEASNINTTGNSTLHIGPQTLQSAPNVNMPDLSTLIINGATPANTYSSTKTFAGSICAINGDIYVNGDVNISGVSTFSGTGCIFATGNINIIGTSTLSDLSSDSICFYSKNGNITFSGCSTVNLQNIIVYAPSTTAGKITFSGCSTLNIKGRVIGNTITTTGCSTFNVTGGTKEFDSLPAGNSSSHLVE